MNIVGGWVKKRKDLAKDFITFALHTAGSTICLIRPSLITSGKL